MRHSSSASPARPCRHAAVAGRHVRPARAAVLLRKAGYEKAVAVSGGTNAWRDASLPVEKST